MSIIKYGGHGWSRTNLSINKSVSDFPRLPLEYMPIKTLYYLFKIGMPREGRTLIYGMKNHRTQPLYYEHILLLKMGRVTDLETAPMASQTTALPLSYTRHKFLFLLFLKTKKPNSFFSYRALTSFWFLFTFQKTSRPDSFC